MSVPIVRWNERAEVLLVEYGNIRFSITRNSCAELIAALEQAYKVVSTEGRNKA